MMVNAHSAVARLDAVSANHAPFPIGLVMSLIFTVHRCAPFLVLVVILYGNARVFGPGARVFGSPLLLS